MALARRRALSFGGLSALCAILALLGQRMGVWPRRSSGAGDALVRRLNALVNASGELRALGELQRPLLSVRLDTDRVLHELFPGRDWAQIQSLTDNELEESLRRSTEADFASGRVVVVGGWFLAKTEACLCQLALS